VIVFDYTFEVGNGSANCRIAEAPEPPVAERVSTETAA
jgi:hypothetical protein